ncbi:ferredoxin [Nocardia sp. NPDC052278]|uniref:ferredoxin n=1 Tax=unclassified Nocardia TaxID=2637762 RepID=UPI0036BDACEA
MRIEIKPHACIGSGQCVVAAPDVFDQNEDDGLVIVLDENPSEGKEPEVEQAALVCPARAILLSN